MGYVAFASMINSMGETATAAHTIANTVESAFYIPGYGMQAAAATLTGNAIGAGDRERGRALARLIFLCEISLMLLSGGLLLAFAPANVVPRLHSIRVCKPCLSFIQFCATYCTLPQNCLPMV